jgi:hypothetical protein
MSTRPSWRLDKAARFTAGRLLSSPHATATALPSKGRLPATPAAH